MPVKGSLCKKPLAPCCKQKAVGCHLSATYLKCQCTLLQVWDFKTLKPEAALTGHGGDVKACDWHPTKSAIASGSKDATVKLWDARAGESCLSTLELHKGPITQVTHLPRTPTLHWQLGESAILLFI